MTEAVGELPEQFKSWFGRYRNVAQFDDGKEFYNVGVKLLLEKHNIKYFSTQSDKKAAIVETFNRTLKTMMWKYFYSKGTHNCLTSCIDLVTNNNKNKTQYNTHEACQRKQNQRTASLDYAIRTRSGRAPLTKI